MNLKSTYILLIIFLSTAINAYAQRDLYNWQLTGHGGLVTFGSDVELPDDVTTSYSYGLALEHRLGRAWTLGVNFMVIERPETERRWTSYAGAQLGFYWDNGFMLSERAIIAPFHKVGFGAKSVQTEIEDIDDWRSAYAFNFENGLKFRISDRISASVSLDLLFPDEITYADDITASDRNHVYKAGITYHFGMRPSSFKAPVFRTSRADDYGKDQRQVRTEKDQQDSRPTQGTSQKVREEKTVYRDTDMEKRYDQVEYRTIVEGESATRRIIITDTIRRSQELSAADSVRIFMHFDSLYQRKWDSEIKAIAKPDTTEGSTDTTEGSNEEGSYENAYMNRRYVQVESDTSDIQTLDDVREIEEVEADSVEVDSTADDLDVDERDTRKATDTISSETGYREVYREPETRRDEIRDERQSGSEEPQKSTYTETERSTHTSEVIYRDRNDDDTNRDRSNTDRRSWGEPDRTETTDDSYDRRTNNRTTVVPVVTPGSGGSKDLEEQNRLLREQNEILRGKLEETPAPAQSSQPRERRSDVIVVPQGTRPARERSSADSTKTERQLALERDSLQAVNEEMQRRYKALLQRSANDELDALSTDSLGLDTLSTDTTRTDTLSIGSSSLDSLETVKPADTISDAASTMPTDTAAIREPDTAEIPDAKPARFDASYPVVCTFGLNSQSPAQEELDKLQVVVEDLKRNPETKALLTGHTDKSGNSDYNMSLSEKRANWVRDYLVERGVSADQLDTEGKGDTEASGRFEPKERRVEIRLTP